MIIRLFLLLAVTATPFLGAPKRALTRTLPIVMNPALTLPDGRPFVMVRFRGEDGDYFALKPETGSSLKFEYFDQSKPPGTWKLFDAERGGIALLGTRKVDVRISTAKSTAPATHHLDLEIQTTASQPQLLGLHNYVSGKRKKAYESISFEFLVGQVPGFYEFESRAHKATTTIFLGAGVTHSRYSGEPEQSDEAFVQPLELTHAGPYHLSQNAAKKGEYSFLIWLRIDLN